MNRKEIYEKIKSLNLQKEVEKVYGDNYTRVSTKNLENLVLKHEVKTAVKTIVKSKKKVNIEKPATNKDYKCDKLIEILKKKHILLDSEVKYLNS